MTRPSGILYIIGQYFIFIYTRQVSIQFLDWDSDARPAPDRPDAVLDVTMVEARGASS